MSSPADGRPFLGIGWAFPPRVTAEGRLAEAAYAEDVRQAVLIVLGTSPGERVMRPDFGAGLSAFVFDVINAATLARIENRVRDALVTWEPRIDVESVRVDAADRREGRLLVELDYRVRATNTRHNLVYPFYVREGA
ncbi:GPW/gp25 family protein [Sphaerisporangium rhizosphaerae]|uniref:GPW/gp25 family protein n=1 Tax=Sphaerisporangium rhizosphaerae TaxID=2269375 RepID=A0ABW2PH59_9ACTN